MEPNMGGIYQPLANSTIRLLDVHSGEGTEPLTLSLSLVSLDSNPTYEAISYHWGSAKDVVPVTCNGVEIFITTSLFGALSQFRLAERRRTLWADAICINQKFLPEKSVQVGLMAQIYSQATRVLIWVGPLDDAGILLRLPEWMKETQALLPPPPATFDAPDAALRMQEIDADSMQRRHQGKPNLYDHDWEPLTVLVARPWFRRKWIVQEVALAREAVLCVGHVQFPWTELALLAYTMSAFEVVQIASQSIITKRGPEKGNGPLALSPVFIQPIDNILFILQVSEHRQRATLVDGVMATRSFLCTDEHDHIYVLLGLQIKHTPIKVDYRTPAVEIFVQFAKAALLEGESLQVLGLAPYKSILGVPEGERLRLPSWAPDLRMIEYPATLVSYSVLKQRFHAGGHEKPILSSSEDRLVLRARGRIIDTVKALAPTLVDILQLDHPDIRSRRDFVEFPSNSLLDQSHYDKWLSTCYDFAVSNVSYPQAELMSTFARTMVCNMNAREGLADLQMLDSFPDYLAARTGKPTTPNKEQRPNPFFSPIFTAISQALFGHDFCVTTHQRLGQIPIGAEPGDHICILDTGRRRDTIRDSTNWAWQVSSHWGGVCRRCHAWRSIRRRQVRR
ncbi:heterokaryon incompatibility protein-domain-containing protein [Xylaria sp. FL1042]|nr:heterokaryon incompatibility protein-domain-containing protein [Xylaria sp. FL1042]